MEEMVNRAEQPETWRALTEWIANTDPVDRCIAKSLVTLDWAINGRPFTREEWTLHVKNTPVSRYYVCCCCCI